MTCTASWQRCALLACSILLSACGGGGSQPQVQVVADSGESAAGDASARGGAIPRLPAVEIPGPAPNVLPMRLALGPRRQSFNTPYVSVTLCRPGTSVCARLDHVIVDTGSIGLRIQAAALPPALADLPAVSGPGGQPVGQCMQFASGRAWGSVRRADVQLAGQQADALPVQVMDDPAAAYARIPAACIGAGPSVTPLLDADGILGVGMGRQDCGLACAISAANGIYYTCEASAGCAPARLDGVDQVAHPVAVLPRHNNGVVLVLPAVPVGGTPATEGALVLGIATSSNNQLGRAQVLEVDSRGLFSTTYKGRRHTSFMDSGSNGLYFPDRDLPPCGSLFCPLAATALQATLTSARGTERGLEFMADSPYWLRKDAVAAHLAGRMDGAFADLFNWGLPAFFGRAVHVAVDGAPTPAGPGPWLAF